MIDLDFVRFWMGFEEGNSSGGRGRWVGIRSLLRRKEVDSDRTNAGSGHHQLAKDLSVSRLIAIGSFNYILFAFVNQFNTFPFWCSCGCLINFGTFDVEVVVELF